MSKLFFLVVMAVMLGGYAHGGVLGRVEEQVVADQNATFPGGADSMMQYFSLNLRYPIKAMEKQLEGEVMVGFEIDEQGLIHNALIIAGIGAECDEEALRVVNAMPRWNPAMKQGKPVAVMYRLPIYFQLPEQQEGYKRPNN